jgi:hypothetical protein
VGAEGSEPRAKYSVGGLVSRGRGLVNRGRGLVIGRQRRQVAVAVVVRTLTGICMHVFTYMYNTYICMHTYIHTYDTYV